MIGDASDSVVDWLLSARQYLQDACILIEWQIASKSGSSSRPTAVLLGYFLENILKAAILEKSESKSNECYEHIGAKLVASSGMSLASEIERELIADLHACVLWGKYPEPGKGKTTGLVRSGNAFFANPTYVFNDFRLLAHLLKFCLTALEHAAGVLVVGDDAVQDSRRQLIDGMKHDLGLILSMVEA